MIRLIFQYDPCMLLTGITGNAPVLIANVTNGVETLPGPTLTVKVIRADRILCCAGDTFE